MKHELSQEQGATAVAVVLNQPNDSAFMPLNKSKKATKEVEFTSAWWCETCHSKEMTHEEVMTHLKEAHGLEPKGLKCQKKMLMHMDGDTWFSFQWEVTVQSDKGEIKMTHSTCQPRTKNDPIRDYP